MVKLFAGANNNLPQNMSSFGIISLLLSLFNYYQSHGGSSSSTAAVALPNVINFLYNHLTMLPSLFQASPGFSALPWALLALSSISRHFLSGYLPSNITKMLDLLGGGTTNWFQTVSSNTFLAGLAWLFRIDQSAAFVALASASYVKLVMNNISTYLHYLPGFTYLMNSFAFTPMIIVSSLVIGLALILSSSFPNLSIPGSRRLNHGFNIHTFVHSIIIGISLTFLSLYSTANSNVVSPSTMEQVISPSVAALLYKGLAKILTPPSETPTMASTTTSPTKRETVRATS